MSSVFLTPQEKDLRNQGIATTDHDGVPYEHVSEVLSDEGKKALGSHHRLFAWGSQSPAPQGWKNAQPGDWVFVYEHRPKGEKTAAFTAVMQVLHTQQSLKLGRRLWPAKAGENPWDSVIFLGAPIPIYIPVEKIAEKAGMSPTMVIKAFTPLPSSGHSKITNKHGSMDNYVAKAISVAKKIGKDEDQLAKRRLRVSGSDFEKKIAKFLDSIGFQILGTGQGSKIGRFQIDVHAHYKDTLVVVECKARSASNASLRNEIINFAGKQQQVEETVREIYPRQFQKIRFAFAVEGVDEISDSDLDLAESYGITVWTDDFLKEGAKLLRAIDTRTRYYVLKELGIKNIQIDEERDLPVYSVPALKTNMEGTDVYVFLMPAKVLLNLAYVYRLKPGNTEAYQRMLDVTRLKEISKFVEEGGGFKNNLICSFDSAVKYEERPSGIVGDKEHSISFGTLNIPSTYGSMWVIDGQHRLFSYAKVSKERQNDLVPVTAYKSDIEQQAKDFVAINYKQKTVSADLLWSLFATTGDLKRRLISRTVKHLNTKPILKNKIYVPEHARKSSRTAYDLFLGNLSKSLLDHGLLDEKQSFALVHSTSKGDTEKMADEAATIINDYYSLIRDIGSEHPKWFHEFALSNNGFSVFIQLLREAIRVSNNKWSKPKAKDVLTEPLRKFFADYLSRIGELKKITSSESTRTSAAAMMAEYVAKKTPEFGAELIKKAVPLTTLEDDQSRLIARKTIDMGTKELLNEEESETLEFKSSLRHTSDKNIPRDVIEKEVVGGVAGLANANGGVMLVGVKDNKQVQGIEVDFGTFERGSRDAFEQHLTNLLFNRLGQENVDLYNVTYAEIDKKLVCRIDVQAAPKGSTGVWLKQGNREPEFYVRVNNTTRKYDGMTATQYVARHFLQRD